MEKDRILASDSELSLANNEILPLNIDFDFPDTKLAVTDKGLKGKKNEYNKAFTCFGNFGKLSQLTKRTKRFMVTKLSRKVYQKI